MIDPVQPLATAAATVAGLRLVLDPDATSGPGELAPAASGGISLAIGPEGGFDPDEMAMLTDQGWRGMRLGPRILRTETAGIVAIAALFALTGEF